MQPGRGSPSGTDGKGAHHRPDPSTDGDRKVKILGNILFLIEFLLIGLNESSNLKTKIFFSSKFQLIMKIFKKVQIIFQKFEDFAKEKVFNFDANVIRSRESSNAILIYILV